MTGGTGRTGAQAVLRIECASCTMQHTDHCRDCVVQALMQPDARRHALVVDAAEERALRELARAGLIPEIRMRPKRTA